MFKRDSSVQDALEMNFLRLRDVIPIGGLSKTEIYRRVRGGRFPKPRLISPRVSVWTTAQIKGWQSAVLSDRPDDRNDEALSRLLG